MAEVYAALIMKGQKKIQDVPERLREAVIKILEDKGFVPPVED